MGNQQARKRAAVEDEEFPKLKKQKLSDEIRLSPHSSSSDRFSYITNGEGSNTKKKRRIRRLSDVLKLSSLKFDIMRLSSSNSLNCVLSGHASTMDRCKSLGQLEINQPAQNTASCSNLYRREFPIPWLEVLFLPEFPSKSLIKEDSFVFSTELGCGSFGCVYRVMAKHDRRGIYAIKVQEKARILSRHAVTQVKREASIQRFIQPHYFISRLYTTWQSRSKLYSVLQYPVGSLGDLFSLWRDYGNMYEGTIQIYAAELACAIGFLHRSSVVYRDLKMENVILDAEGHIQIVDFGLAKHLENGEKTGTVCGTLQYMSPDVSSGNPYSHYVDWWSLGVIMHVLYTGKYPYPNAEVNHHEDLRFIDYSTPVECSSEFGNLLDSVLSIPLRHRLCSFEGFHTHSFFNGIDFKDVEDRKFNPLALISGLGIQTTEKDDSELDGEENWTAFDEKYEFNDFEYFNDEF